MSVEQRRARSPGYVYATIALVIVAALTAFSFTASQPPPPTIAEFAPQAIERIEEAPDEQTSSIGEPTGSDGGRLRPTPSTPPLTTDEVFIDLPRVRRCFGDPPRQTEDPQSPPCVPYWDGDNGGATARGVAGNEVRVVLPTCEGARVRIYQALERFFNARFEFYGRTMRFFCGQEGNGGNDEEVMKAEARGDFEEFEPFAANRYFNAVGTPYNTEMARMGVVSVTNAVMDHDSEFLWTYWMSAEEMFRNMAEWACARLAGRDAVHAGQADLRESRRKFGVIIETGYEVDTTTTDTLERGLAGCGAPVAERSVNEFEAATELHRMQTIMLRMSEAGVTTVFCFCHLFHFGPFQAAASNQAYFPEWIVSTYGFVDLDAFIKLGGNPPEQMENTYGLSFHTRQLPLAAEPWYWAVREADPGYSAANTSTSTTSGNGQYRGLLLIASGIQLAGPNLTPATFEQGLERAVFPNPEHPNEPGRVDFSDGRHGMMDDAVELWWSNTDLPPFNEDSVGTYCYVGGRHRLRSWPTAADAFFQPPCRTARGLG